MQTTSVVLRYLILTFQFHPSDRRALSRHTACCHVRGNQETIKEATKG